MYRPLPTVSLPLTAQVKLQESGFHYCEDVFTHKGVSPEARNLLYQWDLHSNDAWNLLTSPPSTSSSFHIWQEESSSPGIVTWSKEVDHMLGGGVPLEAITELCGAPGSGKTQMCLQLCVDVQIPSLLGGLNGEAIFIDTASNFSPQRVRDMAEACCKHCQILLKLHGGQERNSTTLTSSNILKGIHFLSVHGISQLLAAVKFLPKVLEQHPKVKLIVVDSFAFPFNCGETCSTIDRTSYIYRVLSDLQRLAVLRKLAVVVTNQLTTRLIGSSDSKKELAPALGESMGHRVTRRLLLGVTSNNSIAAILLKGNNKQSSTARFRITKEGIRD